MNYLVSSEGKNSGPYSTEEILRLIKVGHFKPSDLVWTEGWTAWSPIAGVPELSNQGESKSTDEKRRPKPSGATSPPDNSNLSFNEFRGKEIGTVAGSAIAVIWLVLHYVNTSNFPKGRSAVGAIMLCGWIGRMIGKAMDSQGPT